LPVPRGVNVRIKLKKLDLRSSPRFARNDTGCVSFTPRFSAVIDAL
jgi:hypothetical protein